MVKIHGPTNPQVAPEGSQHNLTFTRRLSETVSGTKCQILKEQGGKFCEETTLHGFQYLRTPGIVWRVLWVVAVAGAVVTSVVCLGSSWAEYLQAGTVTYINSTSAPLSDIFFPSVTICNVNQVKLSILEKAGLNEKQRQEDSKHLLKYFIQGVDRDKPPASWSNTFENIKENLSWNPANDDGEPFVNIASQSCSDMMVDVSWRVNKSRRESHQFYEAQKSHTDYGSCCRIFPHLDFINQRTRNIPTDQYTAEDFLSISPHSKNGMENGLRLLVDAEIFEYSYYPRGSEGFDIALADSRDRAVVRQQGFYVKPGTESMVSMQVVGYSTTQEALGHFNPEERDCYMDEEFQPLYFNKSTGFRYEMSNCLYSSIIQKIEETCGCQPVFAVLREKRLSGTENTLRRCVGASLSCVNGILLDWGSSDEGLDHALNVVTNNRDRCLQACQFQSIHATSSSNNYPSRNTLKKREDFCLIINKIRKICKDPYRKIVLEKKYKGKFSCFTFERKSASPCWVSDGEVDEDDPVLEEAVLTYARENLAMIKVFLRDPFYTQIARDVKTTRLQFLGTAGGLMGLCMGFSVVSIIEILYHFVRLVISLVDKDL